MPTDPASAKSALRTAALARRDAILPEARAAGALQLARPLPFPAIGRVVAAYWPIRSEIDPRPLLATLTGSTAGLALPVVEAGGLVFRAYSEGDSLSKAPFGLLTPAASAPLATPDILLVPLAAFDRRGHRLGYGRGYYDAYLAGRRAADDRPLTIGVGFAAQELAEVPAEPHDQRLDWIMTERETIRAAGDGQR